MNLIALQTKVRKWKPGFFRTKILKFLAWLLLRNQPPAIIPSRPAVSTREVVDADLPFYAVSQNIANGHFLGGTFVVRNVKTHRVVVCQANRSDDLRKRFPTGYEIVRSDVEAPHPPEKVAYSVAPGTAEWQAKNPTFDPCVHSLVFGKFEAPQEKREL